jgi:hypothetical protein
MDIGELRRRIGLELALAKREAGERRTAVDEAQAAYVQLIGAVAAPLVRQVATVLRADGHQFTAFTPADSVRLVSDRSSNEFVEIDLDASAHPPRVVGRTSLERGGKGVVVDERPVAGSKRLNEITEEDVVRFLLPEIRRLIVRS